MEAAAVAMGTMIIVVSARVKICHFGCLSEQGKYE